MTVKEAQVRRILSDSLTEEGCIVSLCPYILWKGKNISIDGSLSPDLLDAVNWWIHNKPKQ